MIAVARRLYTIPVTCCRDGQAHEVTDESVAAGRRTGGYQALCGYVVMPAPMAAPVGRPCEGCSAMLKAYRPTSTTARRLRHRQRGRLWRMCRAQSVVSEGAEAAQPQTTGATRSAQSPTR